MAADPVAPSAQHFGRCFDDAVVPPSPNHTVVSRRHDSADSSARSTESSAANASPVPPCRHRSQRRHLRSTGSRVISDRRRRDVVDLLVVQGTTLNLAYLDPTAHEAGLDELFASVLSHADLELD